MNKDNQFDNIVITREKEILTLIINDPIAIQTISLSLQPSDFLDEKNRKIYEAIFCLNQENEIINKNNIIDFINSTEKYQFSDWLNYLENIANDYANTDDLKTNIDIIYNASTKRQLDKLASKILSTKLNNLNSSNKIWEIQKDFFNIVERNKQTTLVEIKQAVDSCYKNLVNLIARKDILTGIPVGFKEIDKLTNGFQPSDLIILAARPSVGKTTLSLNFLYGAAKYIKTQKNSERDKIVYFSLEMPNDQIIKKLLSLSSHVEGNKLRSGFLDADEQNRIKSASNELSSLPILIDDSASNSIVDIQAKLKQISNTYNIKMVLVDYLQLIKGIKLSNSSQYNRQQEVSTISKMLKQFAKEFKCPVIALAQLSRDIEKRGANVEPILSDLRESGAIEQDADLVTFLYREETNTDENSAENAQKDRTNIVFSIAKHRNGATGKVNMVLMNRIGLFVMNEPTLNGEKQYE